LGKIPNGLRMSPQPQLFYEDVFDVARAAVQAAGGAKAVAGKLWPAKPIMQAQKELLDCLNREAPRKLCIEEFLAVLTMAREIGFHQAKALDRRGDRLPADCPQDPKIERDRLADELARAADHFRSLERAVERLNGNAKIIAVK
jgi:hypothetical protein